MYVCMCIEIMKWWLDPILFCSLSRLVDRIPFSWFDLNGRFWVGFQARTNHQPSIKDGALSWDGEMTREMGSISFRPWLTVINHHSPTISVTSLGWWTPQLPISQRPTAFPRNAVQAEVLDRCHGRRFLGSVEMKIPWHRPDPRSSDLLVSFPPLDWEMISSYPIISRCYSSILPVVYQKNLTLIVITQSFFMFWSLLSPCLHGSIILFSHSVIQWNGSSKCNQCTPIIIPCVIIL